MSIEIIEKQIQVVGQMAQEERPEYEKYFLNEMFSKLVNAKLEVEVAARMAPEAEVEAEVE